MATKPFTVDGNIVVDEATLSNSTTSLVLPAGSTITGGGAVLDATNSDTDDLTEGASNLYFTDARADARIALQAGANLDLSGKSTTDLSEGTNLYYTQGRFDTAFTAKSTTDLAEGTNLYYTDTRADARIALQVGANLDLSGKSTTDLSEGTNLYYTDARADARITAASITDLSDADQSVQTTDNVTFANITATGYIAGPATFTIDPAAVGDATGTVVILGDLQVDGTTTTINSTTLDVDDLNITVASGAANAAAANGAGLTVDGASATLTYNSANDRWAMNKSLDVTGTITADGLTVDGTAVEVVSINSTQNGAQINFDSASTTNDWSIGISNSADGDFLIYQNAAAGAGDLRLYTNGQERLTILSGGNVGIGTSSPTSTASAGPTLEISGTAGGNLVLSDSNATTGQRAKYFLSQGGKLYIGHSADNGTSPVNDLVVDSSGNVGIGTTSPSAYGAGYTTVGVNGSTMSGVEGFVGGTLRSYTQTYATQTLMGTKTATPLVFVTNDTQRMRISSGGVVAIGNSSPKTWSSNSQGVLQIGNTGAIELYNTTDDPFSILSNLYRGTDLSYKYIENNEAARISFYEGDINFATAPVGTADTNATITTRLKIENGGNVGIGTSSPNTKLHILAGSSGGSLTNAFEITDTVYTNIQMLSGGADGEIKIGAAGQLRGSYKAQYAGTSGSYNFNIGTNNTNAITIDTSQNVGIGEASPAGKLEVQNTSVNYAILGTSNKGHYFESQSDDNTDGFEIYQQHGSTATRNSFIVNDNRTGSKSAAFLIRGDGNVGIGTSSPGRLLTLFNNDQPVFQITNNTSGLASTNGMIFYQASGSTTHNIDNQGSGSGGDIQFMAAGANTLKIQANGNVGIGNNNPLSSLAVYSSSASAYSNTVDSTTNMSGIRVTASPNESVMTGIWFGTGGDQTGSHWTGIAGSRTNHTVDWGTRLSFYTHPTATTSASSTYERMTIDPAGSVGIGTTSPSHQFHVNGQARVKSLTTDVIKQWTPTGNYSNGTAYVFSTRSEIAALGYGDGMYRFVIFSNTFNAGLSHYSIFVAYDPFYFTDTGSNAPQSFTFGWNTAMGHAPNTGTRAADLVIRHKYAADATYPANQTFEFIPTAGLSNLNSAGGYEFYIRLYKVG